MQPTSHILRQNSPFAVVQGSKVFGAGAVTHRDPLVNFLVLENATAAVTLAAESLLDGRPIFVHATLDGASIIPPSGWTTVLYNAGVVDANVNGITGGAGTNGFHCIIIPRVASSKLYIFAPDNVIGVA